VRPRILNVEPEHYSAKARAILGEFAEVEERPSDRSGLLDAVGEVDILITRLRHHIDAEVFDRAPRLQAVVTATTGLDHIDLVAAEQRGVKVLSLKGERAFLDTVTATAEQSWALLLGLSRHLSAAFVDVRDGNWRRDQFRGHELSGHTLGILGCGRLGSRAAAYGAAFGMKVLVHDIHPVALPAGAEAVEFCELLSRSEILSVHLPLEASTRHILSAEALALLPEGAILINTSRGGIVDEVALLEALETGRLSGAGLDVLDGETQGVGTMAGHALVAYARRRDNLLLSPHIGGATWESMEKTEIFMAQKVRDWFSQGGSAAGENEKS